MTTVARGETYIYVPAVLKENKEWYLDYQYQRKDGSMKRARKYLNCIVKRLRTKAEKRAFALRECELLNEKLRNGWTPEVDKVLTTYAKGATPMADVMAEYKAYCMKEEKNGMLNHATALTYTSMLTILEEWVKVSQLQYIYQFDEDAVRLWLTWAREDRKVSDTTVANYKRWLRSWCTWAIDRGFLKVNVASIVNLPKSVKSKRMDERKFKNRYIDTHVREEIFDWARENDPRLLLAIYLCYYCMIRPKEIMHLRISFFHLSKSMIFIPHDISKNCKDQWVTLPDVVAELMLDLKIFDNPSNWYLFNRQLEPAPLAKVDRGDAIRDRWIVLRKALHLPETMRFYDMKHTGITNMLGQVSKERSVQLQARHHSIEQTEEYVQEITPEANPEIKRIK